MASYELHSNMLFRLVFVFTFVVTTGLDWGGVSREFFELLCVELFDASNGLFMRFNADNRQALVLETRSHCCSFLFHLSSFVLLHVCVCA